MANFRSGGRSGSGPGRGGFKPNYGGGRPGGRPSFGGRDHDDRPREMHDATCSSCGNPCQVPFRPTGDKPVFCRDCFAKQGGGRELGRQSGARGNSRDFVPSEPRHVSPPLVVPNVSSAANPELKKELQNVNAKLERLISAVEALTIVTQSVKASVPPKSVAPEKSPAKKVATTKPGQAKKSPTKK